MAKKKKGVSAKRKASAKKTIKKALESVRRSKQPTGQRGMKTYSTPKVGDNPFRTPTSRGQTHTATRSKAVLKNIKSRIAKRGAAKSKKSKK